MLLVKGCRRGLCLDTGGNDSSLDRSTSIRRRVVGGGQLTGAKTIDRYRLDRRIKPRVYEAGSPRLRFGDVWLADDTESEAPRQVVVKHTGSKEIYPDIARLLGDEQLCTANNIVPLLDYIIDDGEVIAVTPYFPEGTLADALGGLRFAPETKRLAVATRLLDAIVRALDLLHGTNVGKIVILHNDLKPNNIFVSGSNFLLGDFDNSLIHARHRAGGNPDGAASRYAPPERFNKGYTTQGDYWSFGVVLAEVALGRHPFDSGDGKVYEFVNSADLEPDWQLGSPDFLALPREWKALLYGLTTTRVGVRWNVNHLRRWQSDDQDVINEGLEIGESADRFAKTPHPIGGTSVNTIEAAAEEILRGDPAPDVDNPAVLAIWVENEFNRSQAAGQVRQAVEVKDFEERRLRIALALDRNCPLFWRRVAISRNQIAAFARNDADDKQAWIESLRSIDPLAIYASFGREEAATIRSAIASAQENLDVAWREMCDGGYSIEPPNEPPNEAALWRIACQTAFSPRLKPHYLERLKHLSGASALFARPAWISRWSGRLGELSVEQLQVIDHANSKLPPQSDVLIPVKAEGIPLREGSDEELDAQPIIWLATQARLLGKMRVSDIVQPHDLQGGQFYPDTAANLPYYRLRSWLRRTLYPWAMRRLGSDAASRLRRSGVVGDRFNETPLLRVEATLYQTEVDVEGIAKGPTTYACEVRWYAPEGYDVRLVLARPGLFRDTVFWKTPMQSWVSRCRDFVFTPVESRSMTQSGMSRRGKIALSVSQNTVISLVAEPRVPLRFRPSFTSTPIIIVLPKPELSFRRPTKLNQYKPEFLASDHTMINPQLAISQIEGKIRKPGGSIGERRDRTAAMFWDTLVIKSVRGIPRFASPLHRLRHQFLVFFNHMHYGRR